MIDNLNEVADSFEESLDRVENDLEEAKKECTKGKYAYQAKAVIAN